VNSPGVAIVDYGLGNLYSVKQACQHVGLQANITSSKSEILAADAVILPGVGAFGDAMDNLRRLDLVTVLQEIAASSKPLLGVCLGMQLLMAESYEFGWHQGLGIIDGSVVKIDNPMDAGRQLKVPQIGWNTIWMPEIVSSIPGRLWDGTLLDGIMDGEFMYFVHSYIIRPQDSSVALSITRYGQIEFCSSFCQRNIFACQFHPERSGNRGLIIYQNLARRIDFS